MRVIAGTARSIPLRTLPGNGTRPTTDRIKETLFNILSPHIFCDTSFLDLFAGSGAIGIEALSRGAGLAVFVEKDRRAVQVIKSNLKATGFSGERVIASECTRAVGVLAREKRRFDIVFMDPPYGQGLSEEVLSLPAFSEILADDAMIILEEDISYDTGKITGLGYEIIRDKTYKTNRHLFFRKGN